MTDPTLFLTIVALLGLTAYMIATNKTTPEQRDEMLRDEEMWP